MGTNSLSKLLATVALAGWLGLVASFSHAADSGVPEFGFKGINLGTSLASLGKGDPLLSSCETIRNHQECSLNGLRKPGKYGTLGGEPIDTLKVYAVNDVVLAVIVRLVDSSCGGRTCDPARAAAMGARIKDVFASKYGAPTVDRFRLHRWSRSTENESLTVFITEEHTTVTMQSKSYDEALADDKVVAKQDREAAKTRAGVKARQEMDARFKKEANAITKEME